MKRYSTVARRLLPVTKALTATLGSGIGGVLAVATLALASRQGQHEVVAGYAVGVSVAAAFNVVLGGGSTLAYATGDLRVRSAVRRMRLIWITPTSMAGVVVAGCAFGATTSLTVSSVLLGGAGAIANNLSEIEAAHLRQQLMVPHLAAADILTRLSALLMVSLSLNFAAAFAAASAMRFAALAWTSRADPSRNMTDPPAFQSMVRLAYAAPLLAVSLAYLAMDRIPQTLYPLALTSEAAGLLTVTLGVQQGVSAVLVSGLQVALSVRAQRPDTTWLMWLELVLVAAAGLVTLTAILFARPLMELIGVGELPALAWRLFCIGLPFAVIARAVAFRWIATRERRAAAIAVGMGALTTVAFNSAIALWAPSTVAFAVGYPLAECTTLLVLWALWRNSAKYTQSARSHE